VVKGESRSRQPHWPNLQSIQMAMTSPLAGTTIQQRLVQAGWSVCWRKYGDAPEPYHTALIAAQEESKAAKSGAWGTAEKWMINKGIERTRGKD